MYPLEESCACYQEQHPHTILYEILSRQESGYLNNKLNQSTAKHNCHCEPRKIVCLKDPNATCQVASSVLVKTICFLRSLPSFRQLPSADQSSLLRHCWVPLFVLGLAQDKIAFEVTDVPNSSILRQILLGPGPTEKEAERPTLAGVHKLKTCLRHLWNLELSPKEYAYLKGALLFNPGKTFMSSVVMAFWMCDGTVTRDHLVCCSCSRSERLVVRWGPPTGSSQSPQRGHPPPAPWGHSSLQPPPPGSLVSSDCQPQPGVRAFLQASYWQHKHVTFINRYVVCAIRETFMLRMWMLSVYWAWKAP